MNLRRSLFALCVAVLAVSLLGQESIPPVFLGHIQIVLPSSVYAAIQQSPFLKNEMCALFERTSNVTRDGAPRSYTGIYVRGRQTYLELYEDGKVESAADKTLMPAGKTMFGMHIDDRRQLPVVLDRVTAETGGPVKINTTSNATTGQPRWDAISADLRFPNNSILVFAFYPDGFTREQGLKATYLPDLLLREITGITRTVNPEEREWLIHNFRAYGYKVDRRDERQVATGPEVSFTLVPEKPHEPKILVLDLALNREKTGERKYQFADGSDLVFEGKIAKWTFRFPAN